MKRSRPRRWFRRIGLAALLVSLAGLAGGWLGLRYVPTWYLPVAVADDELQAVRDTLAEVFRDVSDRIVAGQPFDVTLDDRTVTRWIIARGRIWPDSQEWIPPWLRDPVVVFAPGRIILAAHLDHEGWESIVALHFSVNVTEDGLCIRLEEATAGAVPAPLFALRGPLDAVINADRLEIEAMPDELAAFMRKLRNSEAAGLVTAGLTFSGPFIWKNGDRPYDIERLDLEQGKLTARLRPL